MQKSGECRSDSRCRRCAVPTRLLGSPPRAHDIGDHRTWGIKDATAHLLLLVVGGEEVLVEVNDRIFLGVAPPLSFVLFKSMPSVSSRVRCRNRAMNLPVPMTRSTALKATGISRPKSASDPQPRAPPSRS